ncbi:MAG: hypothetical protein KVP17_000097 [Porospora cf. gigantea B]|uniref:uncharacterized protein n=1 Tax=Porospora cf. gigantea B TaxID=2853592 RepID=UPI003571C2C0|nr:MAG: hypothetical protein KVP17_000097 [Porospora cf. gigantea B]
MSDGPVDFSVYRKGASNFLKNVKDSEAETVTVQRPGPDAKEDTQSMLCWVNSSRTERSVNFIFKESNKSDVASTNELQETEQMIEDLEDVSSATNHHADGSRARGESGVANITTRRQPRK